MILHIEDKEEGSLVYEAFGLRFTHTCSGFQSMKLCFKYVTFYSAVSVVP
jgi:hypothetical protein